MHAVEVALQGIDVRRPEAAELGQPRIHLAEWLGSHPVETPLRVDRAFHKSGLSQHSQMLGYHRLRHAKPTFDFPDRLLR